jgi:mannose-6-phosphate isomerase
MLQRLTPRLVPKKEWGGEIWYEGSTGIPILVKHIFTTAKLSVQVHPPGKTEMWHIVSATPGAKIAAGFRQEIPEDRLRAASLSGEIMDLLAWHDARPGDTFFLPAGTVHAIGEGLALWEIQQPLDVTYRLYDYGRPRELHVEKSVEISHRIPWRPHKPSRSEALVECEFFTAEKVRIDGSVRRFAARSAELWIVVDGAGELSGVAVRAGEVWQVVAGSTDFEVSGNASFLRVTV